MASRHNPRCSPRRRFTIATTNAQPGPRAGTRDYAILKLRDSAAEGSDTEPVIDATDVYAVLDIVNATSTDQAVRIARARADQPTLQNDYGNGSNLLVIAVNSIQHHTVEVEVEEKVRVR